MRIAFLYNEPEEDPSGVVEDSDPERSPIVAGLRAMGHEVVAQACTLNLDAVRGRLLRIRPDVAFNRVESLGGSDALPAALMLLLESMEIPYTGCPAEPFLATSCKLTVKERLRAAGLPTPDWATADAIHPDHRFKPSASGTRPPALPFPATYILKSVLEHASFAIDDESVVDVTDHEQLRELLGEAEARWQRPYFAERFIDGREFNLAVMGDEPFVLPPAEIDFSAFPAGKPRIVGLRAKFATGSFEFENTPRRFQFADEDHALVDELRDLATKCWRLFGLRGYARVDFRVDAKRRPWILEINSNPCLAPDSGFAAALAEAGIRYDDGIGRILDDALARRRTSSWTQRECEHESSVAS